MQLELGVSASEDLPLGGYRHFGFAFESVVFLKGPNQGETHFYGSAGSSAGWGLGGGIEPYITLGFNNMAESEFTADSWGGVEEWYSINASAYGGLAFEWSNGSEYNEFSYYPHWDENDKLKVTSYEIVITPPVAGSGDLSIGYNLKNNRFKIYIVTKKWELYMKI